MYVGTMDAPGDAPWRKIRPPEPTFWYCGLEMVREEVGAFDTSWSGVTILGRVGIWTLGIVCDVGVWEYEEMDVWDVCFWRECEDRAVFLAEEESNDEGNILSRTLGGLV